MWSAMKYGMRNLFNFEGRDARQTFWYFVLFMYIVRMVSGIAIAVPMLIAIFGTIVDSAKANLDPQAMQANMMGAMAGAMEQVAWFGIAISAVTSLAILPSLVRRLHDSDLSGWWAALPGAIYALALYDAPAQMHKVAKMIATMNPENPPNSVQMMQEQGLMGLLGYAALGLVIYAGVRKSTPGPNRFGEAPVSF